MKKLNYLVLGIAGLALASCSQDEVAPNSNPDGYTVSIQLPGDLGTRAYGQGYVARDLNYAVYEVNENGERISSTPIINTQATFPQNSLETEVSFNLGNGKYYAIAFFAQSYWANQLGDVVYDFDAEEGVINVNYENMKSEYNVQDGYDCFYKLHYTGLIGDPATNTSPTVWLTRPVAEINWGTDDFDEPAVTDANAFGNNPQADLQTTLTTTAYTQFDFFTQDVVAGTDEEIVIGKAPNQFAAPTEEAFPVEGYDYVAMQYVFAPKGENVYDLSLNIENSAETHNVAVAVDNAPVQANYRTNIYGSLLTDNYNVHVVKDPIWNQPDYNIDMTVWDGTVTYPDKVDGGYVVARASDLAGIAEMVKGGQTFEGETVELTSDFDFAGKTFPGIGTATRSSSSTANGTTSFEGVFDGNGHTLSNIVINGTNNANDAAGFIGNLNGANAMLKDVTFNNLQINAPNNEQAGVVGLVTDGATVDGVTVNSGSVTSKEAAGGIVGRILASGTVQNCSNAASVSVSDYNVGGIVGAAYYTTQGTEMTISGCSNSGNITSAGAAAGGIAGLSCATVDGCTNTGAVTGNGTSIGGVIGEQRSAGSVSGCVNAGVVKNNSTAYGAGGVVGWVRYFVNDSYARRNMITVTGCYNYASVYGGTGVGGIVGVWYMSGECNGNFNYAPELVSTGQFVAGIVGDSQWTETNWNGGTTGTLTVNNNQSSTTLANMKGGLASLFVYINNDMTTESGNQMVEPQTYPGK